MIPLFTNVWFYQRRKFESITDIKNNYFIPI